MSAEKEFGFIITQGISRKMTKAKLAWYPFCGWNENIEGSVLEKSLVFENRHFMKWYG